MLSGLKVYRVSLAARAWRKPVGALGLVVSLAAQSLAGISSQSLRVRGGEATLPSWNFVGRTLRWRQDAAETPDVAALIGEVARNGRTMQRRMFDYTWTSKHTMREVNKRGEVTKETVEVFETYPVRGEMVKKLVSRNGVQVSTKRAEDELKRASEKLDKAEREEKKKREKAAAASSSAVVATPTPASDPTVTPLYGPWSGFSGYGGGDILFAISKFLRTGDFHSPRRERRADRETILLDFRPRADFRPVKNDEAPYTKLAGRIWIDALDKVVVRLEAWPEAARGLKDAGAPTDSSSPDPLVVFEQTRLPNGMWLESHVRIKTTANRELFNGVNVDYTKDVSDFRRFDTDDGEVKMNTPKP
jgi:hypothetical protein